MPAWAAALLSMGHLQWRVLRRAVARSHRWVRVTSGAWLVGVMIPVGALSLAPEGWPAWAHALVAVVAAGAMGLTVGALTGRTLAQLLRDPASPPPEAVDGSDGPGTRTLGPGPAPLGSRP